MAIIGVGTTFSKKGSGDTWTEIAEIKSISGPGMKRDTVDTTTLDTTGGYRTFITGFREGGEISLSMNYTKTGYAAMLADFESDTVQSYKITLVDGSTITCDGIVTDLPLDVPEDLVTQDVTIKLSGQPTFVAGA